MASTFSSLLGFPGPVLKENAIQSRLDKKIIQDTTNAFHRLLVFQDTKPL